MKNHFHFHVRLCRSGINLFSTWIWIYFWEYCCSLTSQFAWLVEMQVLILVTRYPTDTWPLSSGRVVFGLQGSLGRQRVGWFSTRMIRVECQVHSKPDPLDPWTVLQSTLHNGDGSPPRQRVDRKREKGYWIRIFWFRGQFVSLIY